MFDYITSFRVSLSLVKLLTQLFAFSYTLNFLAYLKKNFLERNTVISRMTVINSQFFRKDAKEFTNKTLYIPSPLLIVSLKASDIFGFAGTIISCKIITASAFNPDETELRK